MWGPSCPTQDFWRAPTGPSLELSLLTPSLPPPSQVPDLHRGLVMV